MPEAKEEKQCLFISLSVELLSAHGKKTLTNPLPSDDAGRQRDWYKAFGCRGCVSPSSMVLA